MGSERFEITILPSDWVGEDICETTVEVPGLKCGKNGNVPPLIQAVENETEFQLVISAVADPDVQSSQIVFTANGKPENAIKLDILDIR